MNSFKVCRERRGMTQKEVAIELKMSIQAISYWETGERMPSYDKLLLLADLYETTTDELLGRIAPASKAASPSISLSSEEKRMILDFRRLSADNKNALLKNIRFLLSDQSEEKEKESATTA